MGGGKLFGLTINSGGTINSGSLMFRGSLWFGCGYYGRGGDGVWRMGL